jgi:predicted O-linked N-acetylglucosamine transferase (SPINDLY family)
VQVTWLGYPGSTGLETMDWRISDPYLDPPDRDPAAYCERTWRLPETFWCYQCPQGEVPVGQAPVLRNGYVTFGCLNNFCKVNGLTIDLWAQILARAAGSRFVLMTPPGRARQEVLSRFERGGIGADRITFHPRRSRDEYMRGYNEIDISLDTFPYAGHTTSLDAMWMGVPVVSLYGDTCVSRGGLSQLSNLGLADLASDRPESLVEIATQLARNMSRIAELRAGLRDRMKQSPLTDGAGFCVNMEKAFRVMWRGWCGRYFDKSD